jgi:hypothetical protein
MSYRGGLERARQKDNTLCVFLLGYPNFGYTFSGFFNIFFKERISFIFLCKNNKIFGTSSLSMAKKP